MLEKVKSVKREADLVVLDEGAASRRFVRGQNFLIDWIDTKEAEQAGFSSDDETMLLLFDSGATIGGDGKNLDVGNRSLIVLPPGIYKVAFKNAGRGCVLSTSRRDDTAEPLNAVSYRQPDPRVASVGPAWSRTGDARRIQVFNIDEVKAPADNPRLKMFQSSTMSINWVDYDGPRDRTALSPHSHADFEQASLAATGNFVHHLRVSWSKNANEWRDDEHRQAGSPSVLVIPPDLIHTTEGVGPGHHLLIDIFAPPRRDFIARNWIANSGEYRDPLK